MISLLSLFGFADNSFLGFVHFVHYLVGGFFDLMFLVLVLNISFSFLKSIVLHLGVGGRR